MGNLLVTAHDIERFFDLSIDMLCIAGKDGFLKRVNPAFERTLGWTQDELQARPILEFVHPADAEASRLEFDRIVKGRSSVSFQNRCRNAAGVYRVLQWTARPDPESGLIYAVVRDVTDAIAAADRLARSNEELQQFAYVASHDLQEPLRVMAGYAALLARGYRGQFDAQADRYIDHIVDGARRMQKMIAGLLEFARVESGGDRFAEVPAKEAVDWALANLASAIEGSGAVVEIGDLPRVRADAGQLTRVFQNLIENAIRFRSEATPRIRIEAAPDAGAWVFTVVDNGIGVPAEDRDKIFRMFERQSRPGHDEGTGIGLAVCRRIVERHGGRIWVEPGVPGGARFRFTLPELRSRSRS